MIDVPAPGGKLRAAGRPRRALRLAVLTLAALALAAVQAQASGSASVTRVFYDPPSGPLPGCVAPLPAGGGAASASYDAPGFYNAQWEWDVPQTITPGATARIKASIQVSTAGGAGAGIGLVPPVEFGSNAGARQEIVAQVAVGAPGSATDQEIYTFTPTRDFTDGEKLYIRVGLSCATVVYEYTGSAAAAPTKPATRVVPRTTRPVPGVVTSYAAPRPGKSAVLPFPESACAAPAASAARESATPAGGGCDVDIFLVRKGSELIHDPEAVFAGGLVVSDENAEKAFTLCKILLLGHLADLDDGRGVDPRGEVATCLVAVSRILQRAEDLRRRRERTPLERFALMARGCRQGTIRLRGSRRGASPVTTTCRRTAKGLRITFRSARAGRSVGSLIRPSSTLIIGRSSSAPFRAGDRVDVLWTVTPPTTTVHVPAPLTPASLSATAKLTLTPVEAFPN